MTPMIILKNRGRQRFLFSLYHELVCRDTGKCSCHTVLERNDAGQMVPKRYPASVQIDGRGVSDPLPAAVFNVPQVRMAVLKNRKLDRIMLSEVEYQAALVELGAKKEKHRKRVLDAKRAEQGLAPLHEVQAKPAAKKPASKPKARTLTSDKE